jgi:CfrBI-like restriction endonuclease
VTDARHLYDLFPKEAIDLLEVRGVDLVDKLGEDVVKGIVTDVLTGVNVRSATEALTRRRIAYLNAALLVLFVQARDEYDEDFPQGLLDDAKTALTTRGLASPEKRVLGWLVGMTKKQIDNVLRADPKAWDDYLRLYAEDLREVAQSVAKLYGSLAGTLELSRFAEPIPVDWLWALYLLQAVGTQERATRGSEKSMYGKFFEKLVLGGVLHVLGLRLVKKLDASDTDQVFWLSERGERRESDATALFGSGKGVRFDIGFIGTGNPEITLDKASRFERQVEIAGKATYMGTIIIVDTIGPRSRVPALAKAAEASVVQMSASYWPRDLGRELAEIVTHYEDPFDGMTDAECEAYIREKMRTAPFHEVLGIVAEDDAEVEAEEHLDPGDLGSGAQ